MLTHKPKKFFPAASVQLRKTSIKEKEPQENGAKESFFQKPALKHVPQKEKSPPKKDHKIHNLPTLKKGSERVLKSPPRKPSIYRDDTLTSSEEETEEEEEEEEAEIDKVHLLILFIIKNTREIIPTIFTAKKFIYKSQRSSKDQFL